MWGGPFYTSNFPRGLYRRWNPAVVFFSWPSVAGVMSYERPLQYLRDAHVDTTGLMLSAQESRPCRCKMGKLYKKRIGNIPIDAVQVYTNDSRDDYYRYGSGIYIKSQDHNLRIQRRNPDGCSVFRSELIAIDEAIGSLASPPKGKEIWILSDCRSAI
ncbi:uncharacterized protein TNCV_3441071 [Trichonephila clavipes]|uniref:RNase H type-1 domain-containing protein n=1 Tax=Trichonephila clavipes TaxID=2585209 RepID=A0A8X7BEP7_TRICX|nr:uncharacterized protein TNCV_3441071 [Trichonephila clavipes]